MTEWHSGQDNRWLRAGQRWALPILAGAFLLLAGCAQGPVTDNRCTITTPPSPFEAELVAEVNRLRTDPATYADIVRQKFSSMDSQGHFTAGRLRVSSREGRAAVDEAIHALLATPALRPVANSACLAAGAQDHARDRGTLGGFGHVGADSSLPAARVARHRGGRTSCGEVISYGKTEARDVVVGFLVDDGVPSRGHRKALLNPVYSLAGSALDAHRQTGSIAVLLLCMN